MPSDQQHHILEALLDLDKNPPESHDGSGYSGRDIENRIMDMGYDRPGNIHQQLQRLMTDVTPKPVRRADDGYTATDQAKKIVDEDTEVQQAGNKFFDEDDVERFQEYSDQDQFMETLTTEAFPQLIGGNDAKRAVLLAAVSMPDKASNRNRVSVLLNGPPGTAKSELVKETVGMVGGKFVDDKDSEAGIIGSFQGGSLQEKGAAVKADRKVLGVEEIARWSSSDQQTLRDAIENGEFDVNKGEEDRTFNARIRALATTNPGQIDSNIKDRFDLEVHTDSLDTNEETQRLVSQFCETWNREAVTDKEFIIEYLQYATQYDTDFPSNRQHIEDAITEYFTDLSDLGARQIEALFRLSLARARIELCDTVKKRHVKEVCDLVSKYAT